MLLVALNDKAVYSPVCKRLCVTWESRPDRHPVESNSRLPVFRQRLDWEVQEVLHDTKLHYMSSFSPLGSILWVFPGQARDGIATKSHYA